MDREAQRCAEVGLLGVAVVALLESHPICQQRTQPEPLHEAMQQEESTEVRERLCREGDLDLAGARTTHRQNLTKSELLAQTLAAAHPRGSPLRGAQQVV